MKILDFDLGKESKNLYYKRLGEVKSRGYYFQEGYIKQKHYKGISNITGRVVNIRKFKDRVVIFMLAKGDRQNCVAEGKLRKNIIELVRKNDVISVQGNIRENKDLFVKDFKIISLCAITVNSGAEAYLHELLIKDSKNIEILKQYSNVFLDISYILRSNKYLEARTPILQRYFYSGSARPFVTYSNNLHKDMYLRFSSEPLLKEMAASGLDRVYEFGSVFRNETDSKTKRCEIKALEYCSANESLKSFRDILYKIVKSTLHVDAIEEINFPILENVDDLQEKYRIFKEEIVPTIIKPTMVKNLPSGLSPFIAKNEQNELISERQLLIINGMTIAEIYQNERDPFVQIDFLNKQFKENRKYNVNYSAYVHSQLIGSPILNICFLSVDRLLSLCTKQKDLRKMI